MIYRFAVCVLAVCLVAMGQTTVDQLVQFFKSEAQLKHSDQVVADYLKKNVKLRERLDDRAIEALQGRFQIGPKTLAALQVLRDQTQSLAAAKPMEAEAAAVPIPPPSSEEQAKVLDDLREYALNYSRNLPDFICMEVTDRSQAPSRSRFGSPAGSEPAWHHIDQLTARLSYFEQKEDYKLILRGSTVSTNQDPRSAGGAQSFGDFGTMLRGIFEPSSQARFEWEKWGTLRKRRVMEFSYRIPLENSQYRIYVEGGRNIVTAYHGLVKADAATHVVMQVSVVAENIPPDFPVRSASDTLDYEYQDLSGHTFLLPLRAEVEMSQDGGLSKLEKEFKLYRKYSADAEITFDDPAPSVDCKDPKNKDAKECKQ